MTSSADSSDNRRIYLSVTNFEEPTETVSPEPAEPAEAKSEPSPWGDPQTYAGLASAAFGFMGTVGKAVGAAAASTGEAVAGASKTASTAVGEIFDRP